RRAPAVGGGGTRGPRRGPASRAGAPRRHLARGGPALWFAGGRRRSPRASHAPRVVCRARQVLELTRERALGRGVAGAAEGVRRGRRPPRGDGWNLCRV